MAAGAASGTVHIVADHETKRQALGTGYNFQPNDPLFSDKPHLLKVPQSPKIAPLSREQRFEIQAGISMGQHFKCKPHISYNHLQSPCSPLPQKEPLPSARLGRCHNGNLSRSRSLSLLRLWVPEQAGFAGLHWRTWQDVSHTATRNELYPPPPTLRFPCEF